MPFDKISIKHEGGHYAVYINDEFYCSADTYYEAIKEIEACGSIPV